jgi:hypothetical protein
MGKMHNQTVNRVKRNQQPKKKKKRFEKSPHQTKNKTPVE